MKSTSDAELGPDEIVLKADPGHVRLKSQGSTLFLEFLLPNEAITPAQQRYPISCPLPDFDLVVEGGGSHQCRNDRDALTVIATKENVWFVYNYLGLEIEGSCLVDRKQLFAAVRRLTGH